MYNFNRIDNEDLFELIENELDLNSEPGELEEIKTEMELRIQVGIDIGERAHKLEASWLNNL